MGKFEQEILKIDIDKRCVQSNSGEFRNSPVNTCFFGVPSNEQYGRVPLKIVPEIVPEVLFLMDSDQSDLVEAFIHSKQCQTLSKLIIGCSSYSRRVPNYAQGISILKNADCPELKVLSLGEWVTFHNAHTVSGQLGDITPVLQNLSHVEELSLYGHFELAEPITFPNLKEINVENGGPISNATLSNLLRSSFPKLDTLFFDLDCENYYLKPTELDMDCPEYETRYTFPDAFLSGDHLPLVSCIEIAGGFAAGEKVKLSESSLGKRVKTMFLEDME